MVWARAPSDILNFIKVSPRLPFPKGFHLSLNIFEPIEIESNISRSEKKIKFITGKENVEQIGEICACYNIVHSFILNEYFLSLPVASLINFSSLVALQKAYLGVLFSP